MTGPTTVIIALSDQIRAQKGALKKVRTSYRKQRRLALADAIALGLDLLKAPAEVWLKFIDDAAWADMGKMPKSRKQEQAVRYAVLWSYADDPRGEKQASDAFIAVKHLLEKGTDAREVPDIIRKGRGIRALCDEARQEGRSRESFRKLKSSLIEHNQTANEPRGREGKPEKSKARGRRTLAVTMIVPKKNKAFLAVETSIDAYLAVTMIPGSGGSYAMDLINWKPREQYSGAPPPEWAKH